MTSAIKVGSHVRCYDFPNQKEFYMEGEVIKIEDSGDHIHLFMKTTKVIHFKHEQPIIKGQNDEFWCDGPNQSPFDVLCRDGFQRVEVIE